jgi:hypothetical protein
MSATEFKEFRAYELHDNGEKVEVEVGLENLDNIMHSENVLLLVRYDLRRIFIWKGPKSPVRKRFISSRVGSQIQEESAQVGMHLKIVSVDAGDEPVEFLRGFNVQSYEVKEGDKLDDMYYIRNEERKKMEDAATADKTAPKSGKAAYVSPALGSEQDIEKAIKAREKAMAAAKEKAASIATSGGGSAPASYAAAPNAAASTIRGMSEQEEKSILDDILKGTNPPGLKRQNIVIGTALYGPNKVIAKIFGKEVESEKWDRIAEIPEGKIDLEAGMLRVYCKNNQVLGIEVLTACEQGDAKKEESCKQPLDQKAEPKKTQGKRELKPIPKGE